MRGSTMVPVFDLPQIPSLESTNSVLISAPRSPQVRASRVMGRLHPRRSPIPCVPLSWLSGMGLLFVTGVDASKVTASVHLLP